MFTQTRGDVVVKDDANDRVGNEEESEQHRCIAEVLSCSVPRKHLFPLTENSVAEFLKSFAHDHARVVHVIPLDMIDDSISAL